MNTHAATHVNNAHDMLCVNAFRENKNPSGCLEDAFALRMTYTPSCNLKTNKTMNHTNAHIVTNNDHKHMTCVKTMVLTLVHTFRQTNYC